MDGPKSIGLIQHKLDQPKLFWTYRRTKPKKVVKQMSDSRALLYLQGGSELTYKYSKHLPANRSPLTGLPCNGLPTTSVSSSTSSRNPLQYVYYICEYQKSLAIIWNWLIRTGWNKVKNIQKHLCKWNYLDLFVGRFR